MQMLGKITRENNGSLIINIYIQFNEENKYFMKYKMVNKNSQMREIY